MIWSKHKWLAPLLVLILLKSFVWTAVVPIWQTPDEQAHFAQLQWYAEKKSLTIDQGNSLSREVALSEAVLGTLRDGPGNNRFTYHPEYKITYTDGKVGEYEETINHLPPSSRTEYVGQEAAGYPPLYYVLSLPFYNFVYNHGLIDRVFAGRILPIIISLLLATTAYLIGKEVWQEDLPAFVLGTLVSFQPMVSYVSAGIHPDNLLNLLYSLAVFVGLLILRNGVRLKYLLALAVLVYLGFQTKILMVFFLPLAGAVIIFKAFRGPTAGTVVGLLCLVAPIIAFWFLLPVPYMPVVTFASPLASLTFWKYFQFRGPKILFEIWPWYWGVFKWLGVTLPPVVMKIITKVAIISVVGLFVKVVLGFKKRSFSFETKALIFFFLSSLFYLLYLIFWDWRLMQSIGYSQGLQGRYLFTNIVPEMALVLAGLTVIKKFQKPVTIILAVSMVVLNIISLYTVANSYYNLSSWQTFANQAAQYKPEIIKAVL